MSLNIKPGSSEITSNDGSENPLAWDNAKLIVHGEDVPPGKTITFFRGRKTEVIVRAPAEIAKQLRLEIVDANGLVVDVLPTDKWQQSNAGEFKWEVTTEQLKSGKGTLIFISREVNEVWIHFWTAISNNMRDEIRFTLDDKDHDPNQLIILNRGRTHEFACFPKDKSPLGNSGVTSRYTIPPEGLDVEWPEEGQSQTLAETGAILRFICGDVKDGSFTFRVASDNHDGLYQDFLARLEEADT